MVVIVGFDVVLQEEGGGGVWYELDPLDGLRNVTREDNDDAR